MVNQKEKREKERRLTIALRMVNKELKKLTKQVY